MPVGYPRLEEEFHLRLERERQQRENAEAEALRRAARLEEKRKGLELAREAAETAVMIAEDARSAIAVRPTTRLQLAFVDVQCVKGCDMLLARCVGCVPKTKTGPAAHRLATTFFSRLSSRHAAQTAAVLYMDMPASYSELYPGCYAPEEVEQN